MKKWHKALVVIGVFILWLMAGNDFFSPNKDKLEKRREEIRQEQVEQERRAEEERKYRETLEYKAAKEAEEKATAEKRLAEQKAAEERKVQEEVRKQSERQAEEERRASLLGYGVQLNYAIEKLAEHKYKVVGTTNLPNGTELSIDLDNYWIYRREVLGVPDEADYVMTSSEQEYANQNLFRGTEKLKIKNGMFEATFSDFKKLNRGRYELSIISMATSLQPKNVQEIFGEHGKNLFGAYIVDAGVFKEFLSGEKVIHLLHEVYLP